MAILDKIIKLSRLKSPWIVHFNSGACNACDIELVATTTPRFDVERLGVQLKGSPRHADVLVVTGPVTKQSRERLLRIYEQMPEPKLVVALGSCASSGGIFNGCYNTLGGVDRLIPVDLYIPGCPPRPDAIVAGITKLLSNLEHDGACRQVAAAGEGQEAGEDQEAKKHSDAASS